MEARNHFGVNLHMISIECVLRIHVATVFDRMIENKYLRNSSVSYINFKYHL